MTLYSHSRIESFFQCPLKFKFQYIEKIKVPFHQSIEAFMGSRVHETFEYLYKLVQHTKIPLQQELIDFYKKKWKQNWNNNIVIVKQGLTKENYFNLGIKCIKNYYQKNHPFNDGLTIGIEKRILIDLDGTGKYKVQGFIDRLVEKKPGFFEIHDYKTVSNLPDQIKAEEDRQLALYAIGLEQEFNEVNEVELIWHFVVFGKTAKSKRTKQQLTELKKETISRIKEIESCNKFNSNPSILCNWCKFQCICPEFKHQKETENLPANKYLNEAGVVLANKFIELKNKETEIKTELSLVKEAVIAFAKEKNYSVIKGSNGKLSITQTKSLKLPKKDSKEYEKLELLLQKINALNETSSLDQTKIKEFLKKKENKQIEKLLEENEMTTVRVGKK